MFNSRDVMTNYSFTRLCSNNQYKTYICHSIKGTKWLKRSINNPREEQRTKTATQPVETDTRVSLSANSFLVRYSCKIASLVVSKACTMQHPRSHATCQPHPAFLLENLLHIGWNAVVHNRNNLTHPFTPSSPHPTTSVRVEIEISWCLGEGRPIEDETLASILENETLPWWNGVVGVHKTKEEMNRNVVVFGFVQLFSFWVTTFTWWFVWKTWKQNVAYNLEKVITNGLKYIFIVNKF